MYIFGNKDVVTFGPLKVWAENGFVCIEDSRDLSAISGSAGGMTQLHPRQALKQLKGLSDMLGNPTNGSMAYHDEWERHMRFIEQVQPIIQKAREQGSHDDPSMVRDRVRRQKKSFAVSSNTGDLGL